jgi:hypothetical protein
MGEPVKVAKLAGMSIAEVAAAYTKERQVGKAWAAKTTIEKADHIRLLEEILGSDTDVRRLTATEAKQVKDTLLAYPRNRAKNPLTRGKPLATVLGVPNVERISPAAGRVQVIHGFKRMVDALSPPILSQPIM